MKIRLALLSLLAFPVMAHAAEDPFAKVNAEMHHAMMVEPSGNTDLDFVRGMIPHHEGAVAMAKIELENGKDPAIRALAAQIIKSQDKEIALMKRWLAAHESKLAPKPSETMEMPMDHGVHH